MPAQKNTKKFNPALLIIGVVILVVILSGAYFLTQKTGISLPLVSAPLNPNCEHNDPDLCKFLNNWSTLKDYKVTTISETDGKKMEGLMEMSGDDKFHMLSSTDGKEDYNMISIGDTTYTKDYSDGKWWKMTTKPEDAQTTESIKDDFDFGDEEMKDNTKYEKVGKEACESRTCFKYKVVNSEMEGGSDFIFFDDREYRLRKMTSTHEGVSVESIYSYDGVNISEPNPVKDAGENGANMYGAPAGGYSEDDIKKMMEKYGGTEESTYDMPAEDYSESEY